jgi:hypothetical protein
MRIAKYWEKGSQNDPENASDSTADFVGRGPELRNH